MRYQEILIESTGRTLYHGTLRRFVPSILAVGLWPTLGEFTRNAYAESEEAGIDLDELVFAADKNGLRSCISAILGAMEQAGIEDTVDNFFQYGAILVIREGGDRMEHREDDEDEDHPETVEPGNYYSHYTVQVDYALTGRRLRTFLRRQGVVVDRFGVDFDRSTAKALLIRYATAAHPERDRRTIIQKVQALSDSALKSWLHQYETMRMDTVTEAQEMAGGNPMPPTI